jgi:hypothetical protein
MSRSVQLKEGEGALALKGYGESAPVFEGPGTIYPAGDKSRSGSLARAS